MDDDLERVGLLIVRAWWEPANVAGFRARISTTLDLARMPVAGIPVAGPEQVLAVVTAWLEGFVAAGEAACDGPVRS